MQNHLFSIRKSQNSSKVYIINIDAATRYLSHLNPQSLLVLHSIILFHLPISMTISYYDYVLVGK